MNYITLSHTFTCPHGFPVNLKPIRPLPRSIAVANQAVLLLEDLENATIIGCHAPVTPASKPCTLLKKVMLGGAVRMKIEGKTPLLDAAFQAMTDGLPPFPLKCTARQSPLRID